VHTFSPLPLAGEGAAVQSRTLAPDGWGEGGLGIYPLTFILVIQQICIGLVVTRDGFPMGYEILAGNRTDVTTVKEIIEVMEGRYGKANPTFFSFLIRTASGNSFSKS